MMVGLNVFPLEHRYGVVLKCTIIDDYVLATRVLVTLQPLGRDRARPCFRSHTDSSSLQSHTSLLTLSSFLTLWTK